MFWFNPKKNITDKIQKMGMTDIHTHLLLGVDDGVKPSFRPLTPK